MYVLNKPFCKDLSLLQVYNSRYNFQLINNIFLSGVVAQCGSSHSVLGRYFDITNANQNHCMKKSRERSLRQTPFTMISKIIKTASPKSSFDPQFFLKQFETKFLKKYILDYFLVQTLQCFEKNKNLFCP